MVVSVVGWLLLLVDSLVGVVAITLLENTVLLLLWLFVAVAVAVAVVVFVVAVVVIVISSNS